MALNYDEYNLEWPCLKITMVGNGAMGKTSMVYRYYRERFPDSYTPPVFDMDNLKHVSCPLTGQMYNLRIRDTGGGEDYHRIRRLEYPGTNCFLLLNSIDSPECLELVDSYWWPELKRHCPRTPIILVGSKMDLRDENSVTFEGGCQIADKIGAKCYMECSALTDEGVKDVFEKAVELGAAHLTNKNRRKCSIL